MKMILHNLKVAVRNLMKYKLQTAISVLSIAVGIVTLSPVMPIILGSAIVIILIFIIVSWQINRVMKLNPTQIIAKE